MSKRKLKEIVGSRQKSRRALQATKQEFEYIISRTSVNPEQYVENVNETNDSFLFNDSINSNTSSTSTNSLSSVDKSISSDNNDLSCKETYIANDLTEWAVKHKISLSALTHLLHLLHPYHPELPLDSRTYFRINKKYFW